MKEILSANIKFNRELSLFDLFTFHQFAQSYAGSLFILSGDNLIHPKHFTQLVSFFLLNKRELTIVIEGHQVHQTLQHIQAWFRHLHNRLLSKSSLKYLSI
ncbi:hypothetical protein PU629_13115 [Pullulanibacillus sp. KACC 23026]|uniref:hypothetical protein n=1 Tax=Pullulanibacillus sp. KACC 23026 TaxID=3028315 RepID=UPI0023B072D0|nr:hypothetical protein [Pullulanibacillus sp. KACC 23026]WEG11110.1 hypothetical protein PU629_13115 [Pullulanibacillus sp. KACC 23026]